MPTVREALREALIEEMEHDPNVFILGEEVAQYNGAYKVTEGLLDKFGPKRVIDTPITEHAFTGLGVGAAFSGLRPVVEFMTFNFSMQAIDQIINSAAKTLYMSGGEIKCPIVFRGLNGAAAGTAAQHSQCFAAWYSHIPGLKVIAPYSSRDAKGLLKSAIRDPNPVIFLENEILYGENFEQDLTKDLIEIGKAEILKAGSDVTIVSFSIGLRYVFKYLNLLKDPEIINLRTLRPLDIDTIIKSVKKTNKLVIIEEGWPFGGISSEIAAQVCEKAFDYLDCEPIRITAEDVPLPYASNLEKLALITEDKFIDAFKKISYFGT